MKALTKLALVAAAAIGVVNSASALTVDFESAIPAGVIVEYITNNGGVLGALPAANASPLVLTPSAASAGSALLLQPYGALFTFASLQASVSAVGNDFGGDPTSDNEIVYLTVFDIAGNVIGSSSNQTAYSNPNITPVSVSAVGIKYAAFTFSNDIGYYSVDDVVATAVPEPQTYALMGLGIAGLALARRRQKAK